LGGICEEEGEGCYSPHDELERILVFGLFAIESTGNQELRLRIILISPASNNKRH